MVHSNSMKFYTDIRKYGNYIFHRGYENGEQFFEKCAFQPTLFVPTNAHKDLNGSKTPWRSFYGNRPMVPLTYDTMAEAWEKIEEYKNTPEIQFHGMEKFEYQFLVERYPDHIDYEFDSLTILNFDIEVDSTNGFPEPSQATETVTAITAVVKGHYHIWGLQPYTAKNSNVTYYESETEFQLLNKFLDFWSKISPDVVTGWNTDTFDVPYMYNRLTNVLGERKAKLLSPWKIAKKRTVWIKNQPHEIIDLYGIQQLDYLLLYKVFTYKKQESYKLDNIAHVELGEKKLSYEEHQTLDKLYEQDFDRYVDYNIRDVELVDKLEDKLGLMRLAISLAYTTHVNFTDTMKQVRMWDSFIYYWLNKEKIVLPPNLPHSKEYKYEGAYVKEPVVGKHGWILSLDYNSLYPSIIRFLNISPETLVNERVNNVSVASFLSRKVETSNTECAVAANGTMYTRNEHSLLPRMVREVYTERKKNKNLSIEAKRQLEDSSLSKKEKDDLKRKASIHGVLDKAQKVVLNSLYGALGNEYFRLYSTPMAEAITVSGQLAIQWVAKDINEYLSKLIGVQKDYVIYGDTDSVYVNVDDLVQKYVSDKPVQKIADFLDKITREKLEPIVEASISELASYLNAVEFNALAMGREVIANVGIWQAKKRYALNVIDSEGVRYSKPKMKIMGMETAKSSTPAVVRQHMEELLYTVLNKDEVTSQKLIKEIRKKFKTYAIEDIAFPRGVNGLKKYYDVSHIYSKGTPIHVRGALLYNHYIRAWGLDKKYEMITEGEKIKFIHLKEPNPIHENIFSFIQMFPRESGLVEYIDYEKMFEKTFLEPMKSIFDAVGWSMVKQKTLESMFE